MFTCLLFTNPSKYIPSQNTSVGLNTLQIRGFILWSAPNTQKESSRTHFIPQDRACKFAKCTNPVVNLTPRILSSQLSMLISLQHVPFIGTLLCRFPKTFGTTREKSQELLPEHVKWSQRTKKLSMDNQLLVRSHEIEVQGSNHYFSRLTLIFCLI